MRNLLLFLTIIFICPSLIATPTHVELRGHDLAAGKQGYMLPWQDATASGWLREIVENGSEIEDGVPLPHLEHGTIIRYAPCLSIIAQGQRQNELPFAIELTLREYLQSMPDLYNAIHFADYLTVPLLKKVALAEAPAHVTRDNVTQYEERLQSDTHYAQLCHNYILKNTPRFMNLHLTSTLQEDSSRYAYVKFSPNGNIFATAFDHTVKLWETASGRFLYSLEGHTDRVNDVVFRPDGNTVATGSDDSTVKVWETAYGRLLYTLEGFAGRKATVAFSPDGNTIATGSDDSTTKLWNALSGQLIHTLIPIPGENLSSIRKVEFSPDGKMVATFHSNRGTRLCYAHNGQPH